MRHMVRMDEQMICRNSEFLITGRRHFALGAESLKPFLKVFQGNRIFFLFKFFWWRLSSDGINKADGKNINRYKN